MICLGCGCNISTSSKFCPNCGKETVLNNKDNVGKITIKRDKKVLAFAISFGVYIDDVKLGTLTNGSELSTEASLSIHEIKLTSTEKDVIANIELTSTKKEVVIDIVPKMGIIAAKPYIKEIKYN